MAGAFSLAQLEIATPPVFVTVEISSLLFAWPQHRIGINGKIEPLCCVRLRWLNVMKNVPGSVASLKRVETRRRKSLLFMVLDTLSWEQKRPVKRGR